MIFILKSIIYRFSIQVIIPQWNVNYNRKAKVKIVVFNYLISVFEEELYGESEKSGQTDYCKLYIFCWSNREKN